MSNQAYNVANIDELISRSNKPTAPEAKPNYDELLYKAAQLVPASDPEEIDDILFSSSLIRASERENIFKAIKNGTKLSMGAIRATYSELSNQDKQEPDQLNLANLVIEEINRQNILSSGPNMYSWNESGVWKKLEERGLKQITQKSISKHISKVSRALVDGVSDLIINEVYKKEHQFNIGTQESINCLNGELQLDAINGWTLKPHDKAAYRTVQIPVHYDPDAQAPKFTAFLNSIFEGDIDKEDKTQALLEMVGYSLVPHCRHERFVILIGSGSNGKSVLLSVVEALIGKENTAAVQPSQFENKFQRASLDAKLVNIVSELKQGAVIDDNALKSITSGEATTVENKGKDPYVMHPFSTCWFGTNHMPHTRDFSNALFRRAVLLEFNNEFAAARGNLNPNLKVELLAELSGILNMALEAYKQATVKGFTKPMSMTKALDKWRLEADQVAQFIEDACLLLADHNEPSDPLYKAYLEWARDNGIKQTVNARSFKERMLRLGVHSERKTKGVMYLGISCDRAGRIFHGN